MNSQLNAKRNHCKTRGFELNRLALRGGLLRYNCLSAMSSNNRGDVVPQAQLGVSQ